MPSSLFRLAWLFLAAAAAACAAMLCPGDGGTLGVDGPAGTVNPPETAAVAAIGLYGGTCPADAVYAADPPGLGEDSSSLWHGVGEPSPD